MKKMPETDPATVLGTAEFFGLCGKELKYRSTWNIYTAKARLKIFLIPSLRSLMNF